MPKLRSRRYAIGAAAYLVLGLAGIITAALTRGRWSEYVSGAVLVALSVLWLFVAFTIGDVTCESEDTATFPTKDTTGE